MNTSSLPLLQQPQTVVLAAGHGGSDTGATNGSHKERDQAIVIVDQMASLLSARGVNTVVAPHSQDTDVTIPWVNQRYRFGDAWVLEIHRDSASGLDLDDASRRCGVYTGTSSRSIQVGAFIRQAFLRHGAHSNTWSRLHTQSRHGGLGWIRQTAPAAHLLELGFMQGRNDDEHLSFLARIAAAAVYEAFTGREFVVASGNPAAKNASRSLSGVATKKAAPVASLSSQELLQNLAKTYRNTDLAAVFKKVKADVRPEDFAELKEVTLAQWILESGWAGSKLAREALNFGGLKYRKELKAYCTPYEYTDWQGETDPYCKFDSVENFILGYWAFIQRDVYRGWTEHTGSADEFIGYLLECGYTVSDTYKRNVLSLLPDAARLLA
jgi:N-acetylmuramoyl-L-alanine amidase